MRLLAFVDTHENTETFPRMRNIIKRERIDVAICAGDFTIFGRKTKQMLAELNGLGVPLVLIHGNHEDEEEIVPLLSSYPNIIWIHGKIVELNGIRFFGFGGHGFRREEPELERFERALRGKFNERTVVVSHAPPYNTSLDEVEPGWHVGNESLRELITRQKPLLVICGHIHQCFHERDTLLTTHIVNPGPDGEIIEVDDE